MLIDKETITLTGSLLFKNDKVYSHISAVDRLTEMDGCQYFRAVTEKYNNSTNDKEKRQLKKEMLELEANGYCPLDKEVTRLTGALKQTTMTHRDNCRHKKG